MRKTFRNFGGKEIKGGRKRNVVVGGIGLFDL